jgi:hypothetical protein
MTDYPRDPAADPTDPQYTKERVVLTDVRDRYVPGTGFIVGGLVVAVAIIAFFVFGDTGFRETAEVNMPPAVENNINAAPEANAPPANTAPSTDNGAASPTETGSGTAATPPASDSTSTN